MAQAAVVVFDGILKGYICSEIIHTLVTVNEFVSHLVFVNVLS